MPAPGAAGLSASSSIVRGQNRLPPYRAVQIEKGLRAKSPENGNITHMGWRLSEISRAGCYFPDTMTPRKMRESLYLADFL